MRKTIDRGLIDQYHQSIKDVSYPTKGISVEDRIKGAIMGAMIGDALGHGCLWFYDYPTLWDRHGTWIDDYMDSSTEDTGDSMDPIRIYRHKVGIRAGMASQTGQLMQILLETLADNTRRNGKGEFVGQEYIAAINRFFEFELLPTAEFAPERSIYETNPGVAGTYAGESEGIMCWSGRYTGRAIRENFDHWYNKGKKDGVWWSDSLTVSNTSTSEAAEFSIMLAALYQDPKELFYKAYELARFWFSDPAYITQAVVYALVVSFIINGGKLAESNDTGDEGFDVEAEVPDLKTYLVNLGIELNEIRKKITSFDDLVKPTRALRMVQHDGLFPMADDRFAPIVFGPDCHLMNLLPCAYYYAFKYAHDFEKGMLISVNSGGNNVSRSILTGGLLGAMGGIQAIPPRFIDGLKEPNADLRGFNSQGDYLLDLANTIVGGRKTRA